MERAFLDRPYTRLPMKTGVIFVAMVLGGGGVAGAQTPPSDPQTALVRQYCAGCHSDRGKAGGLSLAAFDTDPSHYGMDAEKIACSLENPESCEACE